jgi:formate hydrogenlyase subunit 3/multisubunit Na+/H+ antiporter MnhD subunit
VLDDPGFKMISLSVAGFGIFACLPAFWTLPTAFLSGAAAAAVIAVINSIGNLASFAGPLAMGWIKDHTGKLQWRSVIAGGARHYRDGNRADAWPRPSLAAGAQTPAGVGA